jgi:hypothetical protein
MFNTNVGDMPLDIFSDYISDTLDYECNWEYLIIAVNDFPRDFGFIGRGSGTNNYYNGIGYHSGINSRDAFGNGIGYGEEYESGIEIFGNGFGYQDSEGIGSTGNGFYHMGCG